MKTLTFKADIDNTLNIDLESALNRFAEELQTKEWEVYIEQENEEEVNELN